MAEIVDAKPAAAEPAAVPSYNYRWYWKCHLPDRHSQECRIVAHGRKNTILVEFRDGFRVTTSRYAVRRAA